MFGIVAVAHGTIGTEMVRIVRSIVKDSAPIVGVAIEHDDDVNLTHEKIKAAIQEVQRGDGVLLLADMFGGTPSNLCLSFLEDGKVEVIAGVNLPMLIKIASVREPKSLVEMASFIKNYGQKNITVASEVLKGSGSDKP